jgi:hypothetical protein
MASYPPRRAKPGERMSAFVGNAEVILVADEEGVVQPHNAEEAAVADLFELPVARKAEAERAADKKESRR